MTGGPWDSRLARLVVLPLRGTPLHPNHVTTAGLLTGLAAAALFARGTVRSANWAAALYALAAVLDHADGELARATGRMSAFGRTYDRLADLLVKLAVFVGMGIGLRHGALGLLGPIAGGVAGASFVAIFVMRSEIARLEGWASIDQPSFAGFELEDVLYVVVPVTWVGALAPFVAAAAIGAPLFAVRVARRLRAARLDSKGPSV